MGGWSCGVQVLHRNQHQVKQKVQQLNISEHKVQQQGEMAGDSAEEITLYTTIKIR
jgi:hypothetical protein